MFFFSCHLPIVMHWQFRIAQLAFAAPQSLRSALTAAGITVKPLAPIYLKPADEQPARMTCIQES
jgi:hypothetical protein